MAAVPAKFSSSRDGAEHERLLRRTDSGLKNTIGQLYKVQMWKVLDIRALLPGDHISFHRRDVVSFWQHAIVVDVNDFADEYTIIHFSKKDDDGPRDFAKDVYGFTCQDGHASAPYLCMYPKDIDILPAVDVVAAAYHVLNERPETFDTPNNSEAFARYCKTSEMTSDQRWNFFKAPMHILSLGLFASDPAPPEFHRPRLPEDCLDYRQLNERFPAKTTAAE